MFNASTAANNTITIYQDNTTASGSVSGGLSSGTIMGIDPSYHPNIYTPTITTTTTTGNFTPYIPTHKRCRDCDHAHLNDQCVEFSDWGAITFAKCSCKEYASKDNLEYLEHLYDKKQRKESTSSL